MEKANRALIGLRCCVEFLCSECPYDKFQSDEYTLRCIYLMHLDLAEVLKLEGGINNDIFNNDISSHS